MRDFHRNIIDKHKRNCRERTVQLVLVGIYAVVITCLFLGTVVKLEAERHQHQLEKGYSNA